METCPTPRPGTDRHRTNGWDGCLLRRCRCGCVNVWISGNAIASFATSLSLHNHTERKWYSKNIMNLDQLVIE